MERSHKSKVSFPFVYFPLTESDPVFATDLLRSLKFISEASKVSKPNSIINYFKKLHNVTVPGNTKMASTITLRDDFCTLLSTCSDRKLTICKRRFVHFTNLHFTNLFDNKSPGWIKSAFSQFFFIGLGLYFFFKFFSCCIYF